MIRIAGKIKRKLQSSLVAGSVLHVCCYIFGRAFHTLSNPSLVNLILTSIVDSAASAHEYDHEHRALGNQRSAKRHCENWRKLYSRVDSNQDGFISREELIHSFDTEPEVREFLQALDINKQDLDHIFDLMDSDDSGYLSYDEFVNTSLKAQAQDSRIYLMTVKLQTSQLLRAVREQLDAQRHPGMQETVES